MDTLSPQEREALQRLYRVINHLRTAIAPDISAQTIQAVLTVVLEDGLPLSEYPHRMGEDAGPVIRLLDRLSGRRRGRASVRELFIKQDGKDEPVIMLSPRGKLVRRLILETLTGEG